MDFGIKINKKEKQINREIMRKGDGHFVVFACVCVCDISFWFDLTYGRLFSCNLWEIKCGLETTQFCL